MVGAHSAVETDRVGLQGTRAFQILIIVVVTARQHIANVQVNLTGGCVRAERQRQLRVVTRGAGKAQSHQVFAAISERWHRD